MKENINDVLIKKITEALRQVSSGLNLQDTQVILSIPDDERFGDLSSNIAMQLSKQLKMPPRQIADKIVSFLKKDMAEDKAGLFIADIKVEGAGFINFYLQKDYFYSLIRDLLVNKEACFSGKPQDTKAKVLIEFVSANPTGPLSVAHARQAVVGDALANILKFAGFNATKEYYLNDEGNQINILTDSVALRLRELNAEKLDYPENYYQGQYIKDMASEIRSKNLKIDNLEDYVVGYILDIIKKELDDFGVKFDNWYSQKTLRESGKIEKTLDYLKEKGFIYVKDGASWLESTKFSDDKDRVVIKSDGSYTYLAPDIAYHRDKYERGFTHLINLWGPDHHGYIARLKAAIAALGRDPNSLSVIIVQLSTIFRDGKSIEMSTRKGQYITLREVLDEVGLDAARFFFLMRRTSSHLDFDLDVAKKQTSENPVYYVQYAHARICSILRSYDGKINYETIDLTVLKEKEEIRLIKKSLEFTSIINICVLTEDPYMLTVYLQELAEAFHKFYDLHRVLGQDNKLTQARLAVLEATKTVIACGLRLLGISQPEKM